MMSRGTRRLNETSHDKTNKMTCAPTEDSDPPSLISLHCPHDEALGPWLPILRTAKTLIRLGEWPLRWVHKSFCWFCHAMAQISTVYIALPDVRKISFCMIVGNSNAVPAEKKNSLKFRITKANQTKDPLFRFFFSDN